MFSCFGSGNLLRRTSGKLPGCQPSFLLYRLHFEQRAIWGLYDWQTEINEVFNYIVENPGARIFVSNPDSYWTYSKGLGVGAGGVARFICQLAEEAGVETQIIYTGKPYPPIYELVKKRMPEMLPECPLPEMSRLAMLGDSLASDILGANRVGMFSYLLLTGVTTAELAESAPPDRKPAKIFDTL